ncbi:hypothetical protein ACLMJK_000879 [Lecanora helva]
MPSGFPAFRHNPATAPQYIDRSASSTSSAEAQRYRDSDSTAKEGVKLSKYQYPTERDPKSKKQSIPKVEGEFEKL